MIFFAWQTVTVSYKLINGGCFVKIIILTTAICSGQAQHDSSHELLLQNRMAYKNVALGKGLNHEKSVHYRLAQFWLI